MFRQKSLGIVRDTIELSFLSPEEQVTSEMQVFIKYLSR